MTISDDMRLAIQRQLDAEDDFATASASLDEARRQVKEQQDKEELFDREVEAMMDEMKQDVPLNRDEQKG